MSYDREAAQKNYRYTSGQFRVTDVLTDRAIKNLMVEARPRIIGVFSQATEQVLRPATSPEYRFDKSVGLVRPRWTTIPTDNYIGGIGDSQQDLARHIESKVKNHFVYSENLLRYGRVTKKSGNLLQWTDGANETRLRRFISHVEMKIILIELNVMCCQSEVWFNADYRGIWQIQQSVVDEFILQKRARRQAVRIKRDDRSYHGRNRSQSTRRGVAAGTSVGGQYAC